MSGLKSIELAITVAQKKRDLAGRKLVQAQLNLQHEQGQLDQLESYAADSQVRWTASAQISVSPELLRHHYQFMDRLRQAITMQVGVLADLECGLEVVRKQLIDADLRVTSLQKLRDRKQAELRVTAAKRDQKQTDEFAAMQFARAALRLH